MTMAAAAAAALLVHLLLATVSFLPNMASARDSETATLIRHICKKSDAHYDGCMSSLERSAGNQKLDLKGLAINTLMLAQQNASETAENIKRSIDKASDPFLQQCLNDCFDNYLDAVEQVEDSLGLLAANASYNDIKPLIMAAIADAESCEEGFKDQPGRSSSLTQENDDLYMLCSNSLSILKLLYADAPPSSLLSATQPPSAGDDDKSTPPAA